MQLEKITQENWKDAIFLTTDPERVGRLDEKWVAGNAFSMLQAVYDPDWDCRLLVEAGKPVGFVFYGWWRERQKYLLCRLMIDVDYQGRGYGKKALPLAVEQMRAQFGCQDIYLSVDEENRTARHLYEAFGFVPTEEMDEKERIYVLRG